MDQGPLTSTLSKSLPLALWLVLTTSALDGDRAGLQNVGPQVSHNVEDSPRVF
jgi:hypothetical protein